jgi:GntR family transcriptional repressor for pyruvate dehydrogenase complex
MPPFDSVAARRPLSEQVADSIMSSILTRNLEPGDQLPTEPELIDQYDVSRTVIREAGRILVARGVVSIRPRRGMQVAPFNEENLTSQVALMLRLGGGTFSQLIEVRRAIEPDMAAYAALRRPAEAVAELERLVNQIEPRTEDTAEARANRISADLAFHTALARATQNPFFIHLSLPFNEILTATYQKSPGYTPEQSKTHAEHAAIAEAVADQDPDRAHALALTHITRVSAAAEKLVPEFSLHSSLSA